MSFSYETPKSVPNGAPQPVSPEMPPAHGYETPQNNPPGGQNAYVNPALGTPQATYATPTSNVAAVPEQKSKIAAGLLAIFFGGLGIHKFYLGYTQAGIIMLLVSLIGAILFFLGPLVTGVVALIEGITYLTKSDQDFYQTYVVGDRPWL